MQWSGLTGLAFVRTTGGSSGVDQNSVPNLTGVRLEGQQAKRVKIKNRADTGKKCIHVPANKKA